LGRPAVEHTRLMTWLDQLNAIGQAVAVYGNAIIRKAARGTRQAFAVANVDDDVIQRACRRMRNSW
jgi:hypothetical protein